MSVSTTAELVNLAEKDGFTQGIAWAISVCNRTGSYDGAAQFMLKESGLKLTDFADAEVDEYDLSQVALIVNAATA
jgi:hypothetical protein